MKPPKPIARRKPLRRVSKKRAAQNRVYMKLKREFMDQHAFCAFPMCSGIPEDVHHSRGTAGSLYLDVRHWIALCRFHHVWIGDNKRRAREMGFYCAEGLWNVPDRTPIDPDPEPESTEEREQRIEIEKADTKRDVAKQDL